MFGLRLRQAEGLLESVLQLMGLDLAVPDHTTLSRRARTWRSPNKTAWSPGSRDGPVHVLIDSTGLQVYGAGQWLEEKHGARSRRGWRKLHLALDADSGEIIAHTMTDQDTGDASQVEPLLDQIDGPIGQFTADGAYDGKPTYDAVTSHSADATVVIPPRANAVEQVGHRALQPTGPSYRRDQHRRPDEMASRHWLRQAVAGRDRDRPIQVHHRADDCGRGRSALSRQRSPSAAPSSIACLHAHARNPSVALEPPHKRRHQRP